MYHSLIPRPLPVLSVMRLIDAYSLAILSNLEVLTRETYILRLKLLSLLLL